MVLYITLSDTIFEEVDQTEPTDRDPEGPPARLLFVSSQKILDSVSTEEIGTLQMSQEPEGSLSTVEGPELEGGIANRETHFFVISRDAEGRQTDKNQIQVEIIFNGQVIPTVLVPMEEGRYQVNYTPRDPGLYTVNVWVNGVVLKACPLFILFHEASH